MPSSPAGTGRAEPATRTEGAPWGPRSDEASARALAELAALLGEMEADVERPERGYDHQGRVTAREFAMHALHHGLQFWLEADPARPWFHRWFSPVQEAARRQPRHASTTAR